MTHQASVPPSGSAGLLLTQVGHTVGRSFGARLAPLDLGPRQYLLLRAVGACSDQSQHAAGAALHIPPSRMVVLVDALAERGLLQRVANPTDRRAYLLRLTAAGRRMLTRAAPLVAAHDAEVCRGLDDCERAILIELLVRVAGRDRP